MLNSSIILTEDKLREVVNYFRTKEAFAFDVEASGEHRGVPHLAQLSWMSMATDGSTVVIPFNHPTGPPQLSSETVFGILEPLFFDGGITKVTHGGLYDLTAVVKYWGRIPSLPYGDTIIIQWLLEEWRCQRKKLGLKDLVEWYYGHKYDSEGIASCIEKYPFEMVAEYSYFDAQYTWMLYRKLLPKLAEEGLEEVYRLEMDVLKVLVGMKLTGARVDVPRLEELKTDFGAKYKEAREKIFSVSGKEFNLNSPRQKQNMLFGPRSEGGQGLKPWKLTKGGKKKKKEGEEVLFTDYSTDDEVLESYPANKLACSLRDFGDVDKLLNTYVLGWLGSDKKEGLIYDEHIFADFVQYGTVTGRFSCRAPNLQNIPRPQSDNGKLVRGAFIAEDGGKLVIADYSQIELVVLAHYLQRGALWDGFMAGIDPHTQTAAKVLGKRPEDVTKTERQNMGKTLNFAIVYGAGMNKVASMTKMSTADAKGILAEHARQFPEIYDFREAVLDKAAGRADPYLRTLTGRKRRVSELRSRDEGIRMGAERQAFNSLIQGGAADLIKIAMVRLDGMLTDGIRLSMTVHDELILTAPQERAQEAQGLLIEAMTGAGIQSLVRVPLKADVHIVDSWDQAK
jgi:DNA polymerase I-like protein with 3'-5' exonuclease and polymerase domains